MATKKILNHADVENYFRKNMYAKNGDKWTFIPASKVVGGWKNKSVTDIINPLADKISKEYLATTKTTISNRAVISYLDDVCKAIGLDKDISGQPLKFLGCDANVLKHEFVKISATMVDVKTAGSTKIIKTTLEVIGKRYRRKFYTVNGQIK